MDIPQWYNKKLWSTSKQSIDGKPVRSHSATLSNRRSAYTGQSMSGNWANYVKVNNLTLPNRDRGFTYRYTMNNRPSKSAVNNPLTIYSSNYLNNLSNQVNIQGRNNSLSSTQILSFGQKPVTMRERFTNLKTDTKLIYPSKIIQPQYVEHSPDFYSLTKKYDIVHENIKSETNKVEETNEIEKKCIELEDSTSESLNISHSMPVPQNTPRFLDNSSQNSYPKKSILKKTVDIVYQPNIYNNTQSRTLSASFRPMVSSQPINKFFEIRKNLQSAPGTKREVRFDMSSNNVIEFATNEW